MTASSPPRSPSPAADSPVGTDRLRPGVVHVTLNRPEARNALNRESWNGLAAAFSAAAADPATGAVVLSGGAFFCAGGDLKTPPSGGSGALAAVSRLELAHQVIRQLATLPIPVIAAVEGGAVGLGWSLVLTCDLVVAAADAFFQAPFTARGVVPDGGAGWQLARRAGPHRAAEWLLTGARVPASEAAAAGLVNRLAPPGGAEDAAVELADAVAAASPHAVELTKRLLAGATDLTFDRYLALELATAAVAQAGPDAAEGRLAFRERRPPRWQTAHQGDSD